MKTTLIILFVLVLLLVSVVSVSAHEGNLPPIDKWYPSFPITAIDTDNSSIQVKKCYLDCYYYWYPISDATTILGVGNPDNAGIDDLEIGYLVYLESYWDGDLFVTSLVKVHQ